MFRSISQKILTENKLSNIWTGVKIMNKNIRNLSTIPAQPYNNNLLSNNEIKEFMTVFPDIIKDLNEDKERADIPDVNKYFAKLLEYNLPLGEKFRGFTTVAACKLLEKIENLNPEKIRLANILGWCTELMRASSDIFEDLVDGSEIRCGLPCWYKTGDIGLSAINDGIILQYSTFCLLKKYFGHRECYIPLVELFHDVTLKKYMGDVFESILIKKGKPQLELYTMDNFNSLTKYKTSFRTFYLPVVLGMHLTNLNSKKLLENVLSTSVEIGRFHQMQKDFQEFFGNSGSTEKQENQISKGRCTSLAVMALQRANSNQKKVMEEYFGNPDPEAVKIIHQLYKELNLPHIYDVNAKEHNIKINSQIQQIPNEPLQRLFLKIMENVCNSKIQ